MWLGGGVVASLLLLPEFSLAAKVAKAVKGTSSAKGGASTAKSGASKSSTAAASGKSSAKSASRSVGKGKASAQAAKSGTSGKSGKSTRASAGSKKSTAKTASKSGSSKARVASSRGKHGKVASSRSAGKGRAAASRVQVAEAPEIELPSSFEPTRSFAFGDDSSESRALSLYCVHTGERLKVDYYVDGRYDSDAMAAIDHLLRDYHNDEICQFDPRVLNQLYDIRRALGTSEPFHVYSGYRSPVTNERYRRLSERVAEHSYHLTGQAIDVQLPGRDIRQVRNVAVAMRAGGVGYYPQGGFVHLDSGPVRRW
jgi:uncharacterized protein YcbK (DUF882 family)